MSNPSIGVRAQRSVSAMAAFWALWMSTVSTLGHAAGGYSEDSVKAAFIYRFAGYVDWPEKFPAPQTFTIAVLGADEIAARLQTLTADRTIRNRPVQVRRITTIQGAADAQMLYVHASPGADLRNLLSAVGGQGILTITDEEQGLEAGSTINLVTVDRRVRFEVSIVAARRAGLRISSELLAVATRVQGDRIRSSVVCDSRHIQDTDSSCSTRVGGKVQE